MATVPRWKKILKRILPFVQMAAEEIGDIDENETGTDDVAALWLGYVSKAGLAIVNGKPLPLPPTGMLTAAQVRKLAQQTIAAADESPFDNEPLSSAASETVRGKRRAQPVRN